MVTLTKTITRTALTMLGLSAFVGMADGGEQLDNQRHAAAGRATGRAEAPATRTVRGKIESADDFDTHTVRITRDGTALTARTYSAGGGCDVDTTITLLDARKKEIVENDDIALFDRQYCSEISRRTTGAEAQNLKAGTYYIEVRHWDGSDNISQYFMDITLE